MHISRSQFLSFYVKLLTSTESFYVSRINMKKIVLNVHRLRLKILEYTIISTARVRFVDFFNFAGILEENVISIFSSL